MAGVQFNTECVKLINNGKIYEVLQKCKDTYPNVSTRKNVLSKLKRFYLDDEKNLLVHDASKLGIFQHHFNNLSSHDKYKQVQKAIKGVKVYDDKADEALKTFKLFNEEIELLALSKQDLAKVKKDNEKALQRKHMETLEIDGEELINLAKSYLESKNEYENIFAVLTLTGRRQNELLEGKIEPTKNNFVMFSGQSKIGLSLEREAYEIPILETYEKLCPAWEQARRYLEPNLKMRLKNVCRWIVKKTPLKLDKLHQLRSMYALICAQKFNYPNWSQSAIIASILGESSLAMTLHYNAFKVVNVLKA
jgi:hypothetical protein